MNQKSINHRYVRVEVVSGNTGNATLELAYSNNPIFIKSRTRKRKKVIEGALACLLIAIIFNVVVINFLFFPDCNRETRDCFMVQYLWGVK